MQITRVQNYPAQMSYRIYSGISETPQLRSPSTGTAPPFALGSLVRGDMVNVRHDKLGADTFTFTGLQKQKLESWDYACAEKFKAPMNDFKTKEDFDEWCRAQLEAKTELEQYKCKSGVTTYRGVVIFFRDKDEEFNKINNEKMSALQLWKNYLLKENDVYAKNPALALVVFSAITEDISAKNVSTPPLLQQRVLADTVEQIQNKLAADKKSAFNFNKIYQNNLRTFAMRTEDSDTGETETKWVKIPSKTSAPENFAANVARLKALSHDAWCTKSINAEPYLAQGDFHIYLDQGKPRLGVRFSGDEIAEIQGQKNNGHIPLAYFDVAQKYINDNRFEISHNVNEEIFVSKIAKETKDSILNNSELSEHFKNHNPNVVLYYFYIMVDEKDGKLTISEYRQPQSGLDWSDLGINEDELLKNVISIDGSANFNRSRVTKLPLLQHIGGSADFSNSSIEDLSSLEKIRGFADFRNTKIKELNSLQYITLDAFFNNSQIKELNALKIINGIADFSDTKLTRLPAGIEIDGIVYNAGEKYRGIPIV
jgi:hypothetical protein